MSVQGDEKTRKRIQKINCLRELTRKKRKTEFREQASQQINIAREIKYASVR
ncbi:hypothetical protein GT360_18160 [Vibrio astriarenae]|uniref:Uncharacterized protein n=1 Tax=Vibrio astriarenae TaxID=1481923 RepID=A0A7Z2YFG7_9VIBR|nr:hypothetical protein [Vibrio astriarenae]QIA65463.1 hypothetical protein GT360_18160 [Vibrio astriarenae]